ncbi:MAG: DUF1971 domain-containing protein [Fusobacteriaceae bacterium]
MIDLKKFNKIGETPIMNEDNVFPDILKDHMTPKGKWGYIVVESGELEYEWMDTKEILKGTPKTPILIEPERLHRVILTGPVKFKVEFYKLIEPIIPEDYSKNVLRPGEKFLDSKI